MQVFNVGPDEIEESEFEGYIEVGDYHWAVVWYEQESYEGSGEAVALGKDGLLHVGGISHCSCFGPVEGWDADQVTADKYLKSTNVLELREQPGEVYSKVLELLIVKACGQEAQVKVGNLGERQLRGIELD